MQKTKKLSNRAKGSITDFLFVLPVLLYFTVFTYYPVAYLFHVSFTDWNLLRNAYKLVGLENWRWLFSGNGGSEFLSTLKVTCLYTAGSVAATLVLGLLLAHLFDRTGRMFHFCRAVVVLPKYTAASSTAVIFVWLMNTDYGLINQILRLAGGEPVRWLTSSSTALLSILIFNTWKTAGYAMIIYLSAMRGITRDYYEAAAIDGAGGWMQFRKITLPLLSPTTLFLTVTTFLASMKVFQTIDVMTEGGPYGSTRVLVFWIYELAFKEYRVDRAAVAGCVFFVLLLASTFVTMRSSDKAVHYDA